jgi:hypothetical protein
MKFVLLSKKATLRVYGVTTENFIEVNKQRPDQVDFAKHGIPNNHINIKTHHSKNENRDLKKIIVEIQMVKTQYGVTPLINKRDGNFVTP